MYWSEADDTWHVEQIERAIGIKIEDEPTGDEEKRKLQEMDKNEIIDMLLRAKVCRLHLRPPLIPRANHGIVRLHLAAMCHLLHRFARNQTDPASALQNQPQSQLLYTISLTTMFRQLEASIICLRQVVSLVWGFQCRRLRHQHQHQHRRIIQQQIGAQITIGPTITLLHLSNRQ